MNRPVPPVSKVARRAALGVWATSLVTAVAACETSAATVVHTSEGPVLQLERAELLILVSGLRPAYRPGDRIDLNVLINNQSAKLASARIRAKLIGRGQQPVVEADVATLNVRPADAASVDRALQIPLDLTPGDYTVQVELPPWSFDGRQAGGGVLNATVKVERA
ncbi:MAG: hypothetical protein U0821_09960 [Chloroflexota bacterium]